MCTVILAWNRWPEPWLFFAANRDERLDRPSAPPRIWKQHDPRVLAPVDLEAGGTWWGLNAAGLFAAITNRFGATPPEPRRLSRGRLVLEVLGHRDARSARNYLEGLSPSRHNRFHLVVADRREAWLFLHDGKNMTERSLERGMHVMTERSFGAGGDERRLWLEAELRALERPPDVPSIRALLTRHADDPFAGTCVHAGWLGYGTKSSSILWFGESRRLFHCEGPPCDGSYADMSGLLFELGRGPEGRGRTVACP